MLIYVNQFKLKNIEDDGVIFRTIAGWLKKVTGRHFTVDEIKRSGENYAVERSRVRTYSALQYPPELYSILLSHPDKDKKNSGRQWITEIGIKKEHDYYELSILLEVSDVSTQVRSTPITTRPGLVRFLTKNAELSSDTIGLNPKTIKNSTIDFKLLGVEIEKPERNYPIVLVSNKSTDNKPYIDPTKLQEQLVGLAQVVSSHEEIDSWKLEAELTRKFSAWDGAINIIFPPHNKIGIRNKLLLSEHLERMLQNGTNINSEILSIVTHTSNGFKKKLHFSPSDVRAKRQKDLRIKLKDEFNNTVENSEYQKLAEEAFLQLEEQEKLFDQEKESLKKTTDDHEITILELNEELDEAKKENTLLNMRLNGLGNSKTIGTPLLTRGDEKDKYEDEINEIIIDALQKQLENTKEFSRRYDILSDVILNNTSTGKREEILQEIDSLFLSYSGITQKITSELKRMGLEVSDDGNHNKLKFINDQRYKMTFSKSPSDRRAGANIIKQIKQELF